MSEDKLNIILDTVVKLGKEIRTVNSRVDDLSKAYTPMKMSNNDIDVNENETPIGIKAWERAMASLDDEDIPLRDARRTSVYEKTMKYPEAVRDSPNIQLLHTQVASDLSLNYLTIPAVLSFMDKFRVLQQKQRGIKLYLGDFLHLNVSEELLSSHLEETDIDLSSKLIGNILRLPNDIVYSLIVKSITPRNKQILLQQLTRNLKFPFLPDGYVVSASYYSPMSKALIEFRGKFLSLWDLLTTFVDFPTPPLRSNSHTTGVLSTFLDIIPFDHGNKLYKSMDKDQVKAMKNIKEDFFPVFYSKVREILKESNAIKDLNNTLDMHFSSNKKDFHNKEKDYHNKDYKDRPKSLSYSTTLDSNDNNDNKNDTNNNENNNNNNNNNNNDKKIGNEIDNDDSLLSLAYSSTFETSSFSRLDSKDSLGHAIKAILPCFSMLRTGKCLKADKCNFSHAKLDLIKAWQTMFDDLKSSPFNPNKHLAHSSPDSSRHSYVHTSPAPLSTVTSPIPLSTVSSDLTAIE
jgi:hypothetical protein